MSVGEFLVGLFGCLLTDLCQIAFVVGLVLLALRLYGVAL